MSKYTKAERHEIYKKALKSLKDYGHGAAICCRIAHVQYGSSLSFDSVTKINYPELYLFKKRGLSIYSGWFYDCEDALSMRISVLEFCIYMTA